MAIQHDPFHSIFREHFMKRFPLLWIFLFRLRCDIDLLDLHVFRHFLHDFDEFRFTKTKREIDLRRTGWHRKTAVSDTNLICMTEVC